MATGPSSVILTAPVLSLSAVASGQVTLDLTSIPAGADAVTIAYRPRRTGIWVMATQRVATGTFSISGLTDGETYDFVGIPQEATGETGPTSAAVHVTLSSTASVFGVEELLDAVSDTLKELVWPGSSNKVFGDSVQIVASPTISEEELGKMQMPAALVYEMGQGNSLSDEDPSFGLTRVGITILTMSHGDLYGTKALKGAHRASEVVSLGAGIFDLHDAIAVGAYKILRNSSIPVRFVSRFTAAAGTARVDDTKHVASKAYTLLAAIKDNAYDQSSGLNPPVITYVSPLPAGTVGAAYSYQLTASGDVDSWELVSGTLPTGITLSSTGLLSGTPTVAGDYDDLVIRVLGPDGRDTGLFSISIAAAVAQVNPYLPLFLGALPYDPDDVLPQDPFTFDGAVNTAGNTCNDCLRALAEALDGAPWDVLVEDNAGAITTLDAGNLPATIRALRLYPVATANFASPNFAVIIAGIDGSNPGVTFKSPDTAAASIDGVLLVGYATGAFSAAPSNAWTNANPFDSGTFSGYQRMATLSGATIGRMLIWLAEEAVKIHCLNTTGTGTDANRGAMVGNLIDHLDGSRNVSLLTSGGADASYGIGDVPEQPFGVNGSPLRHGATANTDPHAMEGSDTLFLSLNEMLGDNLNNLWLLDTADKPIIERCRMSSLTTLRFKGLLRHVLMLMLPTGQLSGTAVSNGSENVGWIVHDRGGAVGGTRREGWFLLGKTASAEGVL